MRKIVLITGGNRGIGASIAYEFASHNYNIIIDYNDSEKEAIELKNKIVKEFNVEVLIVKADISKEAEVRDLVNKSLDKFNKIDVLVNNAGIAIDKEFCDRTLEDFQNTFSVNVFGTFLVSKYVSKNMLENKNGKIINISSTNGIDTIYPTSIDYDASKAALISLTKNMALEFAPYINVNSVAPGWVDTDMNKDIPKEDLENDIKNTCLKRIAKPKEIAKVVFFLSSDKASYINGEIVRVDGGMKL